MLLDCIRRVEALEPAGSGKSSVEWAHADSSLSALYLAWQQLDKAKAFAFQAHAIFSQRLDAGDPEASKQQHSPRHYLPGTGPLRRGGSTAARDAGSCLQAPFRGNLQPALGDGAAAEPA